MVMTTVHFRFILRLIAIVVCIVLMTACTPKEAEKKAESPEENNISQDTTLETMEIKIYRFFDDDGLMAYEYTTVSISLTNILADTVKNLNLYTGIKLKNLFYEGTRLIVDLDPVMAEVMDWGSFGSLAYFNAILYTFASYPGVTEIKILIGGEEDIEGSHFSFRGIFPAEAYLNYLPEAPPPQVHDFIFNRLLDGRIFDEAHTYDLPEHYIDEIRAILQTSTWKINDDPPEAGFYSNYYGLLIQDKVVAFINLYNNQTLVILKDPDTGANIAVYWAPVDIYTNIGIYISNHF